MTNNKRTKRLWDQPDPLADVIPQFSPPKNPDCCPHCGHSAKVHSREGARLSEPGTCHHDPPDSPCSCPGWLPKRTTTGEVVPMKPGRIARPRGKGRPSSPGTGFVSAGEVEWPDEDDAA